MCGASVYEYDHFDPPYVLAKSHDPNGIVLLCPTHHAEKTRGILPDEVIRGFVRNPTAKALGRTMVQRPYFTHVPSLSIGGGLVVENTPIPIAVRGEPLIEFKSPEPGSDISRINAMITSVDGTNLLRIVENEWIVESGVWDYEWVGRRMRIRDAQGAVSLEVTIFPPKSITLDKLRFNRAGFDVEIDHRGVRVNSTTIGQVTASNCGIGLALS